MVLEELTIFLESSINVKKVLFGEVRCLTSKSVSGRRGQEEAAGGSLEDWRVFCKSLGHSELLRLAFQTYWGSYMMLI